MEPKRLSRSARDKKVAGVCAGLARYFNIDATLVRIIFLLLAFVVGGGVLAYLICWLVMPVDE
ncbi:MAG: PspC domain-containing protein [Bacteroidales bacterium]|nr:PspC domain-containing protein [Bacteroidales bacterium]